MSETTHPDGWELVYQHQITITDTGYTISPAVSLGKH